MREIRIAILGWELSKHITLSQLEKIPGDIAHPGTFPFPVEYIRVPGTHYKNIVENPSKDALEAMIKMAKKLEQDGLSAIICNCGFNAIFQDELSSAVKIPLLSSSLLQVPLVAQFLGKGLGIAIITADKRYLTDKHLRNAGIQESLPVHILGLESCPEFFKINKDASAELDAEQLQNEILALGKKLIEKETIGAFVLECTDLPPFSAALRERFGLPVFDIVTLAIMLYESLCGKGWPLEKS